jgi:5-methylcytosine-specific restriction protein B
MENLRNTVRRLTEEEKKQAIAAAKREKAKGSRSQGTSNIPVEVEYKGKIYVGTGKEVFRILKKDSGVKSSTLTALVKKIGAKWLFNPLAEEGEISNIRTETEKHLKETKIQSDSEGVYKLLEKKKQIILYGPPGTGKTYSTKEIALELFTEEEEEYEELRDKGRIEFITFHPSYSYEEFIEGITVETEREGVATESVKYKLRPGIFKEMCKKALGSLINLPDEEIEEKTWREVFDAYIEKEVVDFEDAPPYVLIIDEINRGDMAKIFGELITLLEADKRLGEDNELIATLPTSGDRFGVPPNLYIIGTMNTADRSIALLDVALRRRFGFIAMEPDLEMLRSHIENTTDIEENTKSLLTHSIKAIEKINQKICHDRAIGRDKQIGHSYLLKVKNTEDLAMVWRHEILPLLEEYCYGDYQKINQILFNSDSDTEWISQCEGIKDITANNIRDMLNEIISDGE